ncbi:type IV pilus biogenesis protein PilM [Klebsiella sp. PL-2018]|uniref:type IV pilus biogenesis protein PilM n=1 Tax=Klebsiella TaxID=570 RepID=UPI001C22B970|nr:type IV pilus biogenesis protein PilM [Klebsiella sp. PL-2018]QXD00964.1 hypothetical protein MKleb_5463 [Klebsiella sp. PL-2018]
MGLLLWSVALVWLLIAGGIQSQQTTDAITFSGQAEAASLARQMLMVANTISLWRHHHPDQDVLPPVNQMPGMSFPPDSRIHWQLQAGRLWVWTAERPGLMSSLRSHSRHSHLLGFARQRHFIFSDGQASGLSVPAAIPENAIVYLN